VGGALKQAPQGWQGANKPKRMVMLDTFQG
jgi:hypothetical protein